ncbi:hypothetical protein JF55_12970 [Pseudomonas sp. 1-7]|nr:hypothetical protein JF55_12970 [Pseudomonas sp. 1-7]
MKQDVVLALAAKTRQARAERGHQLVDAPLERRRPLNHRQLVVILVGGVEVDRDDQVAVAGDHRHDWQRVEQAAVDQHALALDDRGEQAGNRRRGAHGLVQAAFLEPDLLLVGEVGGDGGEGDRQLFDVDLADYVVDAPEHPLTANGAQVEADVEQAQHVEIIQAFRPLAVLRQLARREDATDHRTHRTAGDTADFIAARLQLIDHADMRIAARTSRAQYQRHFLAH